MHTCECRDCFEITYGPHLCLGCEEAECTVYSEYIQPGWMYDCQREDAYEEC